MPQVIAKPADSPGGVQGIREEGRRTWIATSDKQIEDGPIVLDLVRTVLSDMRGVVQATEECPSKFATLRAWSDAIQ